MEQELITKKEEIRTADSVERFRKPDGTAKASIAENREALFPSTELETLRNRWNDIQVSFVDEPRPSVEKADHLVAAVINRLAEVYTNERSKLEADWARGGEVSTEDLRQALRRYRSFFDRLLSI
jgi:hypothetical protein